MASNMARVITVVGFVLLINYFNIRYDKSIKVGE